MRPYTIVKQIEKRITTDNHHETTVTILNPEEAYAEFPHHIGRIEINQMGMQVFEPSGTLYLNIPADSAYQAAYNTMRNRMADNDPGIMYEFPSAPDASTVQAMQSAGVTVAFFGNGAWQASNGSLQTLVEPALNRITSTILESGMPVETRVQKFNYSPQGIYVPVEDITKTSEIRPSGACMQDVVRKRYSNYTVAITQTERSDFSRRKGIATTQIWPNPASDNLHVSAGASVRPDGTLQIFDLVGKLVYTQPNIQPGTEMEISLAGWANGLYFLRMETQTGIQALRFIKKGG